MKKTILALCCIYAVWGSTYLAAHYALESFPPFFLSGSRFLLAGTVLYCISPARTVLNESTWSHWKWASAVGLLMMVTGVALVSLAQREITSGQAALLTAVTPAWMALWSLTPWAGGARPGKWTWSGIALATAGLAYLMIEPNQDGSWLPSPTGSGLVLLSTLSWTAGSLISRAAPKAESGGLRFTAMTLLSAGACCLLLSAMWGERPGPISAIALASWLYLTVFGSMLALTVYQWLLDNASSTLVATHTYVNPLVAVGLSYLAGEQLSPKLGGALVLVVGGVALIGLEKTPIAQGIRVYLDRLRPHPLVFRPHMPMVGFSHNLSKGSAA